MKCPSCKLENPPTATRCDCGYSFGVPITPSDGAIVSHLRSIDNSLRTIKTVVILWAVLAIIGMLLKR